MYIAYFVILALWIFYKTFREKPVNDTILESIILDSKTNEELSTKDIKLKGFINDWLGLAMVVYTGIVSFGWLILLLVICLDYYGYIDNTPYLLTYQTYDLSSKAFCVLWFLSTSWYLGLNLVRDKVFNFFRLRTTLENAQYIQIESPRTVIQMLQEKNNTVTNTNTAVTHTSILYNIIKQLQIFEKKIRSLLGFDVFVSTVQVNTFSTDQRRYFEYQSKRYVFKDGNFYPISIQLGNNIAQLLSYGDGLTSKVAEDRLELIGPNFIAVHVPNFLHALWQELTGFFYIYQLQILWVYFYLDYWQIGVSDTGVILLAAIIKVVIRIRSETRIKEMAEHVNDVKVLRDGKWKTISTSDLVPGDVFETVSQHIVPVDAVILQGDIVVDESSLTGEPLPIRKFPLRDDNLPYDRNTSGKINTLFSGTTIKQASSSSIALVLESRSNTEKGKLIQRILFPQEVSFIFHEQLKLVFIILLCYAIFMLGVGVWWNNNPNARMTAFFYGLTLVAQVMNPILPAMLVVGQSIASGRLRKKGIFCVDLPRILMAGKAQVFCFDKTGTLTKEGLEYYGVYPVSKINTNNDNGETIAFGESVQHYADLKEDDEVHQLLKWGLSTCHSVTTLDDTLVGNFVDVVMVEATGASISTDGEHDLVTIHHPHNNEKKEQLEIIQRFEFQHARASMSVVVRNSQTGRIYIFCKGAFERIKAISNEKVPNDFDQATSNLAYEGCYVLGMAYRDLGVVDPSVVLSWTRDELESNLSFFGLVLFKNLLKEDTKDAITELKKGDTRTVMITGDNALTGIFIGKQCGLVPPVRVLVGDITNETTTVNNNQEKDDSNEKTIIKQQQNNNHIVWKDAETGIIEPDLDLVLETSQIELAITGKAFRQLVKTDQMRNYLLHTRVFARMTPLDKMECVELFMERAVTAMCGDGGNDCGALRTAHVGLAMSEAEASIVSPFSTSTRSIHSCVELLRQGRAALATSFASYRYLIMYGQTMVTVKFCTFYYTMSFSQWNFILIDAFITLFCSFAVTQSGAAKKLSDRRPTARILSAEVLLSVIGQLFINAWFLIGAYIWLYTRDDFFRCNEWNASALPFNKWQLLGNSFEADILTFITLYQFINSGFVFNYGYIYRKVWYRNYLLLFVWALFVAIISYWELADPNIFGCLMKLNCGDPDTLVELGYPRPDFYIEPYNIPLGHNVLPKAFRYQLWAYSIGNFLLINIWELFILYGPVRSYYRSKYSSKKSKIPL
ncbi:unnamed protein product [Cunninghamella echinulata]